MSETTTFRGVFAPVLTPFHEDLTPDAERWIAFSRHLLDSGCHGLCPFGTTSEANSVGIDERMDLLEQLVAAGIPAAKLMPGTGMCAMPDSVRLTTHAVKLGVGGVLMLPPFYYKGVSDDGLFASIAEVIEGVGDDRLRIYLYHIPPIAQVGFPVSVIERLVSAYPGTVVGVKDSSRDWDNLRAILTTFTGMEFGTLTGTETVPARDAAAGRGRHHLGHVQPDSGQAAQALRQLAVRRRRGASGRCQWHAHHRRRLCAHSGHQGHRRRPLQRCRLAHGPPAAGDAQR